MSNPVNQTEPNIRLLRYSQLLLAFYGWQKLKMLENDLFVKTLVFFINPLTPDKLRKNGTFKHQITFF